MSLSDRYQELSQSTRRAQLRTLIQRCDEIPTVPHVVETVTALTDDINCSLASLESAIKADASCVARLLQMANAAFYGSSAPRMVTSVRRAILMFGFNAVKNITLNLTVFDCFRANDTAEIASVNTIRLHNLAVGTLSQYIAQTARRDIDEELAFCAGLLHDFGRVVLLHFFPQEYHELLTQYQNDPEIDMSKLAILVSDVKEQMKARALEPEIAPTPPAPELHETVSRAELIPAEEAGDSKDLDRTKPRVSRSLVIAGIGALVAIGAGVWWWALAGSTP